MIERVEWMRGGDGGEMAGLFDGMRMFMLNYEMSGHFRLRYRRDGQDRIEKLGSREEAKQKAQHLAELHLGGRIKMSCLDSAAEKHHDQ